MEDIGETLGASVIPCSTPTTTTTRRSTPSPVTSTRNSAPGACSGAEIDGRKYHVVGGRVSHAVANPTFDPIANPGALHDYFRGNPDGTSPLEFLRDASRYARPTATRRPGSSPSTSRGWNGCWLFPTLGMLYEELLSHDPLAVCHTFRAFNRWLGDDWGFNYRERIFSAPYITLSDLDVGGRRAGVGARAGARHRGHAPGRAHHRHRSTQPLRRPCSIPSGRGQRGRHDRGRPCGRQRRDRANGYAADGFAATFQAGGKPVHQVVRHRARHPRLSHHLMFEKLFDRFPNLRIASVENGAEFLPDLFKKIRSTANKMPGYWKRRPGRDLPA